MKLRELISETHDDTAFNNVVQIPFDSKDYHNADGSWDFTSAIDGETFGSVEDLEARLDRLYGLKSITKRIYDGGSSEDAFAYLLQGKFVGYAWPSVNICLVK